MPLYQYKCSSCEKSRELLLPMLHNLPKCPDCNSSLEKEVASGSFRFDGGSPTGSRPGV